MTPTKKSETAKPAAKKAAAKKPAAPRKAAAKKPAAPKHAAKPVVAVAEAELVVKTAAPEVVAPKSVVAVAGAAGYIYALGRRKRAIVQARLFANGKGEIKVNGKPLKEYFTTDILQSMVMAPLKAVGLDEKVNIDLKTIGGGMVAQAGAARHSISRALVKVNADFRKTLKPMGFMTRDPREKERKKYGLKKARKGPQWAKR